MEVFIVLLVLFLLAPFLLPTLIAFSRDHRNRWIIFINNIVFGATILGWLIALVWVMNKIDDPRKGGTKYGPSSNDSSF